MVVKPILMSTLLATCLAAGLVHAKNLYKCPDGAITDTPQSPQCLNMKTGRSVGQEVGDRKPPPTATSSSVKEATSSSVKEVADEHGIELDGGSPLTINGWKKYRTKTKADGAVVSACVDLWRPTLKDPGSAIAISAVYEIAQSTERATAEARVKIDGRANNSFGALTYASFACVLKSPGEINEDRTKTLIALTTLGVAI